MAGQKWPCILFLFLLDALVVYADSGAGAGSFGAASHATAAFVVVVNSSLFIVILLPLLSA